MHVHRHTYRQSTNTHEKKINQQTKQQNFTLLCMKAEPITSASGRLRAPSTTDRTKSTLPGWVRPLTSSSFSGAIPHTLHFSTLLNSELNCGLRVTGAGAVSTPISALPGTWQKSASTHLFKVSSAGTTPQSQHSGGGVRKISVSLWPSSGLSQCPQV